MRQRLVVPFEIEGKVFQIPTYTVRSHDVANDGATLDVFVPIHIIVDAVKDIGGFQLPQSAAGPLEATFFDYRDLCQGQGKCVTWRDLSTWAWKLKRKDGKPNKATLQILFFAQCVMRGFLSRLVKIEAEAMEQMEAGEIVFWPEPVEALRGEVKAYKHVDQDRSDLQTFVKEEVKGLWRRLKREAKGKNKENLKQALSQRGAQIIELYD